MMEEQAKKQLFVSQMVIGVLQLEKHETVVADECA